MRICLTLLLALQAAVVGERKVLLYDGQYGLKYFPDGCISVLTTSPKYRVILPAGVSSYLLEGPGMDSLKLVKKVLGPGPKGSFDNGYAGIYGTYYDRKSDELLAVYHAEDQEEMPRLLNGVAGFYASIGLAVSKDVGDTFTKAGPVITSCLPKNIKGRSGLRRAFHSARQEQALPVVLLHRPFAH